MSQTYPGIIETTSQQTQQRDGNIQNHHATRTKNHGKNCTNYTIKHKKVWGKNGPKINEIGDYIEGNLIQDKITFT